MCSPPDKILGVSKPKKFLDALENDTKVNFQENIPGKQWGAWSPAPLSPSSRALVC